jgi:ferredoxin
MKYLEKSEEITGYRVKIWERDAFKVTGYALIVPPADNIIPDFWNEIAADGRLDKLINASSIRPWVLELDSWDEECEPGGLRCTICIEETEHTDFSCLSKEYPLYTKELASVDWMCFETTEKEFDERFWNDDPYEMMRKLGYQFCWDVGVHFDAYPPDYDPEKNPVMEFWISVMIPKVAVVNCRAEREQTESLLKYDGTLDCREAHSVFADSEACDYRCLGYGSCAKACKFEALRMNANELPMIDEDKCIACGACVRTCPRGIITLIPKTQELVLS